MIIDIHLIHQLITYIMMSEDIDLDAEVDSELEYKIQDWLRNIMDGLSNLRYYDSAIHFIEFRPDKIKQREKTNVTLHDIRLVVHAMDNDRDRLLLRLFNLDKLPLSLKDADIIKPLLNLKYRGVNRNKKVMKYLLENHYDYSGREINSQTLSILFKEDVEFLLKRYHELIDHELPNVLTAYMSVKNEY
ncbi:MAG: hypothetical protein ACP5EQ_06480 [Candidatus Cloacimonadia bacterium]